MMANTFGIPFRLIPDLDNGDFMGYIGIGFDNHEQKLAQDS
jgi:hypothetical protein